MAGRLPRPAGCRTRIALVLAAALLAGGAATAQAGGSARRSSVPLQGGVNVIGLSLGARPSLADSEIALARKLHARIVRAGVWWSALEPLRQGSVDSASLAFLDRLVADASAGGMRVILTVDSSPCWASSAPARLLAHCVAGRTTAANAWPPSSTAAYAAVTAYLARRYGSALAGIEVWNEPDQSNQLYFAGPNKVQRYAALLRAAYTAIKQGSPTVPVLGGSLVGSNAQFLRALYAAGVKGYYDGLSVHFYSLVLGSLRAIREVQLANGDTRPLWLDEFGWTSCYPKQRTQEEQACVTERTQARNLSDTIRSIAQTPWIAAEVVYNLQDAGHETFGLVGAAGARKLSFSALAQAFLRPLESPHPVILALRRRGNHVVASGSGPVGDYLGLEAFVGGTLRYRALFVLDRFDHYSIPLPAVLGSSGMTVRVFQYWAGLAKAAQATI